MRLEVRPVVIAIRIELCIEVSICMCVCLKCNVGVCVCVRLSVCQSVNQFVLCTLGNPILMHFRSPGGPSGIACFYLEMKRFVSVFFLL